MWTVLLKMRSLFLAALVVCLASPVMSQDADWQKRRCLQDPLLTGRTCPEAVCVALQEAVDSKCTALPPECQTISNPDLATMCLELLSARDKWSDCSQARFLINEGCWDGGDEGHLAPQIKAELESHKCIQRLIDQCGDPCP